MTLSLSLLKVFQLLVYWPEVLIYDRDLLERRFKDWVVPTAVLKIKSTNRERILYCLGTMDSNDALFVLGSSTVTGLFIGAVSY
jgi:hypothetical protein